MNPVLGWIGWPGSLNPMLLFHFMMNFCLLLFIHQ
jgi:hypothetical protein